MKPERAATSSHRGGGASGATEAAAVARHLLLQRLKRLSEAARLTDTAVEDMESAVGLQLTALHAPHAVATVRPVRALTPAWQCHTPSHGGVGTRARV